MRNTLSGRALAGAPVEDMRIFSAEYEQLFADAAAAVVAEGVALAREAGLDAAGEAVESGAGAWRALAAAAGDRGAAVIVAGGVALAREAGLDAAGEAVESGAGAWRALAAAAGDRGAAVIVAGSRGRGGLASTILGSVSSGLVHNAETPALIVRPSG
jgi:nucleotide-binding universal stress UspA family protein